MQGQFIFATCNRAGLGLTALLRNTSRNDGKDPTGANELDMQVSLKVFHAGVLEYECADFATIRAGGFAEVSGRNCPLLKDETREFLLLAHCRRAQDDGYFAQEHQVIYESRPDGRTTSLLYDQMPVPGGASKINSILLLAPKVWVSTDVDTFITLANVGAYVSGRSGGGIWHIDFLAQNGARIHHVAVDLVQNGSHVIDVKDVARGETAMCAILTFLRNRRTHALALEHSLSPHYYMDGDFARVRKEAFLLSGSVRGSR
jgi:hypothetical protein